MNLNSASIKDIGDELARRGKPFVLMSIVEGDFRDGKHEVVGKATPVEVAIMMHTALDYIGDITGLPVPPLAGLSAETICETHEQLGIDKPPPPEWVKEVLGENN